MAPGGAQYQVTSGRPRATAQCTLPLDATNRGILDPPDPPGAMEERETWKTYR